jgi:hypothetical protein
VVRPATADVRDTVLRLVEPATVSGDARRATKSAMIQKNSHGPLPRFRPSTVPDALTQVWSGAWVPTHSDTVGPDALHTTLSGPARANSVDSV